MASTSSINACYWYWQEEGHACLCVHVCCLWSILVLSTFIHVSNVFGKSLRHLKDKIQCLQPVDWPRKLYLAHGVVCGMEYLHSIQPDPVIHGDLKTQNVLVGDSLVAKVCVIVSVWSVGQQCSIGHYIASHSMSCCLAPFPRYYPFYMLQPWQILQ